LEEEAAKEQHPADSSIEAHLRKPPKAAGSSIE